MTVLKGAAAHIVDECLQLIAISARAAPASENVENQTKTQRATCVDHPRFPYLFSVRLRDAPPVVDRQKNQQPVPAADPCAMLPDGEVWKVPVVGLLLLAALPLSSDDDGPVPIAED